MFHGSADRIKNPDEGDGVNYFSATLCCNETDKQKHKSKSTRCVVFEPASGINDRFIYCQYAVSSALRCCQFKTYFCFSAAKLRETNQSHRRCAVGEVKLGRLREPAVQT